MQTNVFFEVWAIFLGVQAVLARKEVHLKRAARPFASGDYVQPRSGSLGLAVLCLHGPLVAHGTNGNEKHKQKCGIFPKSGGLTCEGGECLWNIHSK